MKKNLPYLILTPGCVLLLFFMVVPLLSVLLPTFFPDGFSIVAYLDFFKSGYNLKIFFRTIRVSIIVAAVSALLGIPVAYYISGISSKWKGILMAMTLFPLLTNSVIRSFAWINILGKSGVVNTLLLKTHIIEEPLKLLYTDFSVIIGSIYLFLPTMVLALVGVMDNIDDDILEAAETLGANKIRAFFKVVLPLCLPGIIVGSILVFTGTLTAYTTPQLLGGNKNMLMATFLYQKAMALGDWNSASVIAFIMIVTTLIVIKLLNILAGKLDKRGEEHA